MIYKLFVTVSLLVTLCFAVPSLSPAKGEDANPQGINIKIMTYNVENLFDSVHDEGREDWEFLPLTSSLKENCATRPQQYRTKCFETDWSEERFQHKVAQITKAVYAQGSLPDVLALQEVENNNVVDVLAKALGYESHVFEEGQDKRGIDVALLFNADKISYIDHQSRIAPGLSNTRDILAVYFKPKGKSNNTTTLAVYVNHWPSQASPAPRRMLAAKGLRTFIEEDRRRFGDGFHALATGDFNVIHADFPHPIHSVIKSIDSSLAGEALVDVLAKLPRDTLRGQPYGTNFYPRKMSWDHLDRFFATRNLLDGRGAEIILSSYRIGTEGITTSYSYGVRKDGLYGDGTVIRGIPFRFDANYKDPNQSGFSDHFPVVLEVRL